MKKSANPAVRNPVKFRWDNPLTWSALLYTGLAVIGIYWADFGMVLRSLGF
jgi:hypothetical protein